MPGIPWPVRRAETLQSIPLPAFCLLVFAPTPSQRAASGGDLGAFSIVPAVALVCLFISWLVTDDVEPPQNLTKVITVEARVERLQGGVGGGCHFLAHGRSGMTKVV